GSQGHPERRVHPNEWCTAHRLRGELMSKTARTLALVVPLVGLSLLAPPANAGDRHSGHEVEADLSPIPGSGVRGHGEAEVEFDHKGRISEFEVEARGLLA